MTPTLRTAILDALMERWREDLNPKWVESKTFSAWLEREKPLQRDYFSSCLDMILPVAEPMIREAALREAAAEVLKFDVDEIYLKVVAAAILALGEPK